MKEFVAKVDEKPDQIEMELSGFFDESSKLPSLKPGKKVIVRFKKLNLMNSYGIKIWCKWAEENKSVANIVLQECPFVFTKNFPAIRGFLTPNMTVESFYVPFYNDDSLETKDVLLVAQKDFNSEGAVTLPEVLDSRGVPMELDVNPQSYFQFLRKK